MPTRLTPTSFVVLGLVEKLGATSPYELKRFGQGGLFLFWSVPHTQIYGECDRLSGEGLLAEEREQTGRRRRVFRLTPAGQQTLDRWREDPATTVLEVRDEGLLKLYLGAERGPLARSQSELHRQRADFLQTLHEDADLTPGQRAVADAGIALERHYAVLWEAIERQR